MRTPTEFKHPKVTARLVYRMIRQAGGTRRKALAEASRALSIFNPRGDNKRVGITWGQTIGRDECPYMKRWVLNLGLGSIRVHHWYRSDDPRWPHDHPWPFVTFVLSGTYTDLSYGTADEPTPEVRDTLHRGSVRWRPARHLHTVQVEPPGCWTLLVTGRHGRDWGFLADGTWVRMRRFFKLYGHHPCE